MFKRFATIGVILVATLNEHAALRSAPGAATILARGVPASGDWVTRDSSPEPARHAAVGGIATLALAARLYSSKKDSKLSRTVSLGPTDTFCERRYVRDVQNVATMRKSYETQALARNSR